MRQQPYSHAELRRLLHPASIAIVGASERIGTFGERSAENLKSFEGELLLVNPRYTSFGDRPVYSSLADLPTVPDCVIVAVPATDAGKVVSDAVALGVGGVILFASGFAELGDTDGATRQAQLAVIVEGSATRLIGPNCIGIFNHLIGARMSFTLLETPLVQPRPSIGIVSQSGALGTALGQAACHGTAVSHILTAGNSCDVDVADLVNFLVDDPSCSAIACMFEGLVQPERFMLAARRAWAKDKPLIVYKMATGSTGKAAAMSHTGSLAGSNELYAAAFDAVGAIQVAQPEDLIETATFFAKAPRRPLGSGAAILSVSGGGGIIAADKAEEQGVRLPVFPPETEALLADIIPPFGSTRNPCDITAELLKKPEMLDRCADIVLAEPDVGAIVYPHPFARDGATERMTILGQAAKRHDKVFCAVWMTRWLEGPGAADIEADPDVNLFRSMDRCFATLSAWQRRAQRREQDASASGTAVSSADRETVATVLASGGRVIGESTAKGLLRIYGVPVVEERLVHSLVEAVAAGTALGFPLVAKIESPDILHKTEAGMVILNIDGPDALRDAYDTIMARAAAIAPAPRLNGVLLQPMVSKGLELVLGGLHDRAFGPAVVFGFGGVLIELLNDSVTALAPISPEKAEALLPRLSGYRLLSGFRGSQSVDIKALSQIISRVSHFIADHRDQIEELDINPLIATDRGLLAVDALIIRPANSSALLEDA